MADCFADLVSKGKIEDSVQLRLASDHVAIVTLNRPAARNAINAELTCRLAEAVKIIEADPAIRAAILTGADGHFCAGADLKEVLAGGLQNLFTADGGLGGFSHAERLKPWIAAVEGIALAGGFELVLGCDMVIASSSARFGLPEVKRGLIASAGGIYRLPRALPKAIALEMVATGESIDVERASTLGLINRLVPAGSAMSAAVEVAQTICANAPLAVRESLIIARRAFDSTDTSLFELGNEAQSRLQRTADFAEGSRAFVEKRAARWSGS